jgi:hypothetical protein
MSQGPRGGVVPQQASYNQGLNRQAELQKVFFSTTNYARILQPLREQYERKIGKPELPEEMDARLQKTLKHYMNEVYRVNASQNVPIQNLNQEVFRETSLNTDTWLQKQPSTSTPQQPLYPNQSNTLFDSVGSRFEREQQSRAPPPTQTALNVDFELPKDDEEDEDPLEKFERLRKQRDMEARAASAAMPKVKADQLSEPSALAPTSNLPILQQNNPAPPPLLAPRPQEYIIKQEDVVKYKENEVNLFIYSGDRDWLNNRNENRYNFTLSFNPANNSNSSTFSPSVKERFKNIVRMELVKTIISAESLDVSVRVASGTTDTSRVLNVLSYPYLMIRISEWTSNGFGTSANIDNTFGLVQYDQTWKSDNAAGNFGYISMTPRYLKAQRVYAPAPLATLQKLSIQVERPDGAPLTTQLDTLDIGQIYLAASTNTSSYSTIPDTSSYIFIKTKTYFSRFFVGEGDCIQIQGYDIGTDLNVISQAANDFNSYINRSTGHIVVGVGNTSDTSAPISITDGTNAVGYGNYIIIRSRFLDPTTGATTRDYFGSSSTTEALIKTRLETVAASTKCALLNTNRQSHFVLRLITREMDAASNLRPDNS